MATGCFIAGPMLLDGWVPPSAGSKKLVDIQRNERDGTCISLFGQLTSCSCRSELQVTVPQHVLTTAADNGRSILTNLICWETPAILVKEGVVYDFAISLSFVDSVMAGLTFIAGHCRLLLLGIKPLVIGCLAIGYVHPSSSAIVAGCWLSQLSPDADNNEL